jgi:TonB family protein
MSLSHPRRQPAACSPQLRCLAVCTLALASGAAWAQTAASATPPATGEISASDRAKRDAEKVFQWIRIHSDKPRKAAIAATPAPPPAVATARPARPANRAADSGIIETVTPLAGRAEPLRDSGEADRATAAAAALNQSAAPTKAMADASAVPATPTLAAGTPPAPADAVLAAVAPPSRAAEALEQTLVPIHRTDPEFSPKLMHSLRKGSVQVSFTVKPDGTVGQAQAVSSTHPKLKDTAVATVSQWRFKPLQHAQQGVVELGFNVD